MFPLGLGLLGVVVPVYATQGGMAEGTVGLLLGVSGLWLVLLALPMSARVERQGPFRWLGPAALCAGASYLFLAWGGDVLRVSAALAVFSVAEALFSSAVPTAVSRLAPPGARGAYQGAWNMVIALAVGSALVLGGLARDATGWPGAWLLFSALTLLAGLGLVLARPWFAPRGQP
ncbi:MAG: hypothetical protein LC624_05125 [Halobacteriales archaeon]|nr:hypothetical protein [Halobacteriales archaeon]